MGASFDIPKSLEMFKKVGDRYAFGLLAYGLPKWTCTVIFNM